jgi:hypothetical protein
VSPPSLADLVIGPTVFSARFAIHSQIGRPIAPTASGLLLDAGGVEPI